MERPANSRIRHGNPFCANYGCKREVCVEALRAYKRENDANRRAGIRATVSVAKAQEHLHALLRADMATPDMEEISGVDIKTLTKIINGRCERIHRVIEESILGIPIPEYGWESSADCHVDALPAMRRLRALGVQGFTVPIISRETGVDRSVIGAVRAGRRTRILMSSMRAIKKTHDRLYDADPSDFGVAPGDLVRARKWAEREGWYPTEAWVDIDDPKCEPVLNTPRYVALVEDARELMNEQGYTRMQAAERLGISREYLNSVFAYYSKMKAEAS